MQKKIKKKFFVFAIIYLNSFRQVVSIKQIMLVMGSQCVNKPSSDFVYHQKRHFPMQLPTFTVIIKSSKGAVIQIGTNFRPICHVICLIVF